MGWEGSRRGALPRSSAQHGLGPLILARRSVRTSCTPHQPSVLGLDCTCRARGGGVGGGPSSDWPEVSCSVLHIGKTRRIDELPAARTPHPASPHSMLSAAMSRSARIGHSAREAGKDPAAVVEERLRTWVVPWSSALSPEMAVIALFRGLAGHGAGRRRHWECRAILRRSEKRGGCKRKLERLRPPHPSVKKEPIQGGVSLLSWGPAGG